MSIPVIQVPTVWVEHAQCLVEKVQVAMTAGKFDGVPNRELDALTYLLGYFGSLQALLPKKAPYDKR